MGCLGATENVVMERIREQVLTRNPPHNYPHKSARKLLPPLTPPHSASIHSNPGQVNAALKLEQISEQLTFEHPSRSVLMVTLFLRPRRSVECLRPSYDGRLIPTQESMSRKKRLITIAFRGHLRGKSFVSSTSTSVETSAQGSRNLTRHLRPRKRGCCIL